MKKIGIITFHNGSNYGAALQTFALQEAIKKNSKNVMIINYDNKFISKGLNRVRVELSLHGIYYLIYDLTSFFSNGKKIKRFKKFFEEYYCLTQLMSKECLKKSDLKFDLGISGSDQIWNPLLNDGVDDIYFLNFGAIKEKISYASSFGNYKFDDDLINNKVEKLLKDYKCISTRENAKKLEELIKKDVENVCDPTLLLTKEEWYESLSINEKKDKKYLLVYALADFDHVIRIAKIIAKDKKLDIIYIGKTLKPHLHVKMVTNAGPKEFVEYFYNAEYIVTNSFHGTAFAVNFNKQFISVRHTKSPERAEHLLKLFDLEDRLLIDDKINNNTISDDKYISVNCKLNDLRTQSYEFLMLRQ